MQSANLRVHRKLWTGRSEAFEYIVYLDGSKIGTLRNGAVADFKVNGGHHEIQLKIPWGGGSSETLSFSIEGDTLVAFECEPYFLENVGRLFDRKRPAIRLTPVTP